MGYIICHHKGVYNLYSTISEGFLYEDGLDIEQLVYWYEREYGPTKMSDMKERVDRAHTFGTSYYGGRSLKELIVCNRAGDDEKHLTYDEIISRLFKDFSSRFTAI